MRGRDPLALAFVLVALYAVGVGVALFFGLRASPGAVAVALDDADAPVTVRPASGEVTFIVTPGMSAGQIAAGLAETGVIADERQFNVLLDYTGAAAELRTGCYVFGGLTPAAEVIRRLREGLSNEGLLTIPEGLRLEEVGDLVAEAGLATLAQWEAALEGVRAGALPAQRPEGASLLGYLLPASYPLGCGETSSAEDLVAMMVEALDAALTDDLLAEAAQRGLSLHQVLTLASVVEKEAVLVEEMPVIASAFHNRLEIGMALQADPTVQFVVASASGGDGGWWPAISLADKEIDSPHNTYVYPGLPPGPIANPGVDAILAVIRPADTDYLYFVATCDGTNRHYFAETLDEQIANVARCHS